MAITASIDNLNFVLNEYFIRVKINHGFAFKYNCKVESFNQTSSSSNAKIH